MLYINMHVRKNIKVSQRGLEVKLPTIWTNTKEEVGRESWRRRREVERGSEEKRNEKKGGAGARKGKEPASDNLFSMICVSRGSKSGLAKAVGVEPADQMRDRWHIHFQIVSGDMWFIWTRLGDAPSFPGLSW